MMNVTLTAGRQVGRINESLWMQMISVSSGAPSSREHYFSLKVSFLLLQHDEVCSFLWTSIDRLQLVQNAVAQILSNPRKGNPLRLYISLSELAVCELQERFKNFLITFKGCKGLEPTYSVFLSF